MKSSSNEIGYKGFWLSYEGSRNKWCVEYLVSGKKKKKRFPRKIDAIKWGKDQGRKAQQGEVRILTDGEETKLKQAIALCGSVDVLLDQARKYAINPTTQTGLLLEPLLSNWYHSVMSRNWNYTHWSDMGSCMKLSLATFGDRNIEDVSAIDIYNWLLDIRDRTGISYMKKHKCFLSQFFQHIVMQPDVPCSVNPVLMMTKIKERECDKPKKIFLTPEETAKFLWTLEKNAPSMITRFALGLFGGLRPMEVFNEKRGIQNLPSECIDTRTRQIRITGDVAKRAGGVARPRIIEDLPDTLWLFLDKYGTDIDATGKGDRRRNLWKKAGLDKPYHSILRHSFATMATPIYGMETVATHMGHQGTAILNRHYKGVVDKATGMEYFGIKPNQ